MGQCRFAEWPLNNILKESNCQGCLQSQTGELNGGTLHEILFYLVTCVTWVIFMLAACKGCWVCLFFSPESTADRWWEKSDVSLFNLDFFPECDTHKPCLHLVHPQLTFSFAQTSLTERLLKHLIRSGAPAGHLNPRVSLQKVCMWGRHWNPSPVWLTDQN